MRHVVLFLIASFLLSCTLSNSNQDQQANIQLHKGPKIDTIEVFIDSTNIGIPTRNKIHIASVKIDDTIQKAFITFYSLQDGAWKLRDTLEDDFWSVDFISPDIIDFNNDGYKDLKYLKGTGARGGNGINNLLIYDKKNDNISFIINSESYPNLDYNKETNSIICYILTGSVETVFLRLDSNRLKPYASIEQYDRNITVYEFDDAGKQQIIYEDTTGKYEPFARFINYKPLKVAN